jgi:small subunit ribosomal protein S24e
VLIVGSTGAQVADPKCIFLWGFKIAFGGQRSTGFGVIYDTLDLAKKSLSKHLLMREGLREKPKGQSPLGSPMQSHQAAH